jgi:hypothetical protein
MVYFGGGVSGSPEKQGNQCGRANQHHPIPVNLDANQHQLPS